MDNIDIEDLTGEEIDVNIEDLDTEEIDVDIEDLTGEEIDVIEEAIKYIVGPVNSVNGQTGDVVLNYGSELSFDNGNLSLIDQDGNILSTKSLDRPYTSLERLASYLYKISFKNIPEYIDSSITPAGCSSLVSDGKLYRNLDWYYDESPTFLVECKGFTGIAINNNLTDTNLNDTDLGQLPYRMVDGINDNGIMMSVHVLYNDWGWHGSGTKTIPLHKVPYLILTNVKSMATISSDLAAIIPNITTTPTFEASEYLAQFLITDGTTTYVLAPPTSESGDYQLINITSNPKLTNFRWVNYATVTRNASYMQDRPTGVERWNEMTTDFSRLRFTKAYETPTRLSEFIGVNDTDKDSSDAELTAIYNTAHQKYLVRTRNGELWQTMHSVVYSNKGIEELYVQENWNINYISSGTGGGLVDDVVVNGVSVVDENKIARIEVPTDTSDLNNDKFVEYIANQNLTSQQKLNARNNIEALGSDNVMQGEGESTEYVISQKGVTDLLADKQDKKPNGTDDLVSDDTGKINLTYIPSTVLGGITNAGTFNSEGIIQASSYAPELDGLKIDTVELQSYPSYYFICSGRYGFAGYSFDVGDWAISLGNGWAKLNATDAVTSVNGKMGQVVLNNEDVGAVKKSWGTDNKNKNLVTDENGNVTVSEYALGQIIVDYFEELPMNVPATARASVINSSKEPVKFNLEYMEEKMGTGEPIPRFEFDPRPLLYDLVDEDGNPVDEYISFYNNDGINGHTLVLSSGYGLERKCLVWERMDGLGSLIFSPIRQLYINEFDYLSEGWNKLTVVEETGEYTIERIFADELPVIENVTVFDMYVEDERFFNFFYDTILHLAGDYVYTKKEFPETGLYWKYIPANTQADWAETDVLSLGYIKNKPAKGYINTNNNESLEIPTQPELLEGTVNLHKVSKTGEQEDVVHFVGKRNHEYNEYAQIDEYYGGEIFNDYENNTANGENSHVEGENCHADGKCSHVEGLGNTSLYECDYQHIQGKYAKYTGANLLAHIIGNGTDDSHRKNIHEVDWNGDAWYEGNVYVGNSDNRKMLAKTEELKELAKTKEINFVGDIQINDALALPITSLFVYGGYDENDFTNISRYLTVRINDREEHFAINRNNLTGIDSETNNYIEINENGDVLYHENVSSVWTIEAGTKTMGGAIPTKAGGKVICSDMSYEPVLGYRSITFNRTTTERVYVIFEIDNPSVIKLGKISPFYLEKGTNTIATITDAPSSSKIEYSTAISGGGDASKPVRMNINSSNFEYEQREGYGTFLIYNSRIEPSITNVDFYPTNSVTYNWLQDHLREAVIYENYAEAYFMTDGADLPNDFQAYCIITELEVE